MRTPEQIAMEVWEEEISALKQHLRAGTIDVAEAQRRRAVLDESCALFAQGRHEEAVFGVGGCWLNTPLSGYLNRRFAHEFHTDWMAGLPPGARTEVRPFTLAWPERWWVSSSKARPRSLPPDIEERRARYRHLRCIHPQP